MARPGGQVVEVVARRVADATGIRSHQRITVHNGIITSVTASDATPEVDLVAPGLVDLQVNGYGDTDLNTAAPADWGPVTDELLAHGVTSWMPTLVTAPLDSYASRLDAIAAYAETGVDGPRVLGVHLEGPFLGGRPGVHNADWIRPVDTEFLDLLPPVVALITIAPEALDQLDVINTLRERGITVALGHTAGSAEEFAAAVNAGATLATHCWNAMSPLHHRNPGPIAAALTDDRVTVALIADGVHVDPLIIELTARCKPVDKLMIASDVVARDGVGVSAHAVDRTFDAPRDADGRLSGSGVMLDVGLRTLVNDCGIPLPQAIAACTSTPLATLGITDRGTIEPGRPADLCIMSDQLEPMATVLGGRVQWVDERRDPAPRWIERE